MRELKEKTGLEGVELTHRGMSYVHAANGEETISKLLAHVFSGSITGEPELTQESKSGKAVWMDSGTLNAAQCMPGFKDIETLLTQNDSNLFFTEIDAVLG